MFTKNNNNITESLIRSKESLKDAYNDYVTNVSTAQWAISLETSSLIWAILDELNATRIMDTGSGWSSYVLRAWAKKQRRDVHVTSVDCDQLWLKKSVEYCKKHDVSLECFVHWNDEEEKKLLNDTSFDFILHDLGNREVRMRTISSVTSMLSDESSIILYDDMHKDDVRSSTEKQIEISGLSVVSHLTIHTHDKFGRFGWVAKKSSLDGHNDVVVV